PVTSAHARRGPAGRAGSDPGRPPGPERVRGRDCRRWPRGWYVPAIRAVAATRRSDQPYRDDPGQAGPMTSPAGNGLLPPADTADRKRSAGLAWCPAPFVLRPLITYAREGRFEGRRALEPR